MLETLKETLEAIDEIKGKTGWTLSEVAREANTSQSTLYAMTTKAERTPSLKIRQRINQLLTRIRRKYG